MPDCARAIAVWRLRVVPWKSDHSNGDRMADLDENKRVVRSFYEESFNGGDPEGAVERY